MSDPHVRAAARAIRRHVHDNQNRHSRHPRYAEVVATSPLTARLNDTGLTLSDEALMLSQWARKYDYDHTIDVGDTLLITEMSDGDWLVSDVVSDKNPW